MRRNSLTINKRTLLFTCALVCAFVICGVVAFFLFNDLTKNSPVVLSAQAQQLRELKDKWRGVIEEKGPEAAYAAFLQEAPLLDIETHSQAHAFGEALYEAEGIEGLWACDSSFEFGCYHSFFGVAVHNEGIETLPQFDEACKDKYGNKNLPCQHGIGHGVLVYTDYDNLEDALVLCETINTLATGGCSSGVFMEYNFHTMDDSNPGYIRAQGGNLHEPCDSLPLRFQQSCYFEQVQWWQNLFGDDFEKIGELCAEISPQSPNYTACYNGAGNYAAAHEELDLEGTIALCALMPEELGRSLCHEGASWLIHSDDQRKDDAAKLCAVLDEPFKSQCSMKLNFSG